MNLYNFTCLLVDSGKVLCSSANELQQNSDASSREHYIPQMWTVLSEILRVYIWPLWPFVFCLLRLPISASHRMPDRFYVISMEFLSLKRRLSSSRNFLSGEERGETDVFAGYRSDYSSRNVSIRRYFLVKGEGIANLHVTFGRVNALVKWFWGHPFHRKFSRLLWPAHIFINLSHQPKVWHFNPVVMSNKNITGSKVSVNKVAFCEMILITIKKRKTQLKLSQTIIS